MNKYYYLHSNGDIIGKKPDTGREQDFQESPFVKKYWLIDTSDRKDAWILVVEALAYGARIEKVKELAEKWGLTKEDLIEFITRHYPTPLQKEGLDKFIVNILGKETKIFWHELSTQGKTL